MENESDIFFSHQRLLNFINKSKTRSDGILHFLNNANYRTILDFKDGLEWFNVTAPLTFSQHLQGKIVLLDFFTYCCINCMHILPDLKELENCFTVNDGLVVIGVHSAKFTNEKISSNILAAVQRYNISHPVVNDFDNDMWRKCEIQCWPTLLVLGPRANPLLMLMGEGHKDLLHSFIDITIKFYKSKGEISNHKISLRSAFHLLPELKGPLLFPGKITNFIDENNFEILAISDTGNNRILILQKDGRIIMKIGGNRPGFKDGNLDDAEFHAPQGLVFRNKNILYVADTENHAIRLIDLVNNSVSTVVGTGYQGNDYSGGNMGTLQEISSPWDVCIYRTKDFNDISENEKLKEVLIITMAGTHQIWALFLDDIVWWKSKKYKADTCICIAGSGKEENRNNHYPHAAAFAQPSGITVSNKNKEVFIADSESSTIRRLSLIDGKVTHVAGGDRNPNNLFAFGDKDGTLYDAKFQHPLGLALSNDHNTLFIADTYNHKIKKIDVNRNVVSTLCGMKTENACDENMFAFIEPGDLCIGSDNNIYIVDTNHHMIKVLKFNEDYSVKNIKKLEFSLDAALNKSFTNYSNLTKISNKSITFNCKGGKLILNIKMVFENGLGLTEQAPQKWSTVLPNILWSSVPNSDSNVESIDVVINIPPSNNKNVINFVYNTVTCSSTLCLPKNFVLTQPIEFTTNGSTILEDNINIIVGVNSIKIE